MEKFSTGLTGYKKEEVNKFVSDVINQVELMIDDLKKKDNELAELKNQLEHYKNMENTFNRAILIAEDASNQIKRIAKDESNSIIDDARKSASRIVNDALIKAERTQNETLQLKRNIETYKRRLRSIIEQQLDLVDDIEHIEL